MDDHLEMTWSSLVQTKQDLNNMKDVQQKFQEVQEINLKMSESLKKITEFVADCRAEIRDLSLAVKTLEVENIQQRKFIEEVARKTAKEKKDVESRVLVRTRHEVVDEGSKWYTRCTQPARPVSLEQHREQVEQAKPTCSYPNYVYIKEKYESGQKVSLKRETGCQ